MVGGAHCHRAQAPGAQFSSAGLAPKALESRRVRVRGWVEERNGPRIEATSPEQIEIAER